MGVAIGAIAASYAVLGGFYGAAQREVYMLVENQIERVVPRTVEEAEKLNPYVLTCENNESGAVLSWSDVPWHKKVKVVSFDNIRYYGGIQVLSSPSAQMAPLLAGSYDNLSPAQYVLTVKARAPSPAPAADRLAEAGTAEKAEDAAGTSFFVHETKPINVFPIAASIGISMGLVALAVWVGYRRMWGDAASTLLEHGLHDMTVRDVEIVGQIMELKEFTIPQLMKETRASKPTVWRTVQKLVEQGLVQPTEQTRLAANGLGGRGKPSHVYKYVGAISKE